MKDRTDHPESPGLLEYERPAEDFLFSVKRFLALGYVAACVFGLILMSIVMAWRI